MSVLEGSWNAHSPLAVLQDLHVIAAESKALDVRELRGITKFRDRQVSGGGHMEQSIAVTRKLNSAFRSRVDVNHSKHENFCRAARLHIFGKWLSVLDATI